MDLGLKGKVAMVAGASRGLGRAVAQALSAEGAIVSMASRDTAAVEKAAREVRSATGTEVLAVAADVRQPDALERWFKETLHEHGRINLLFANSGGPPAGKFADLDDAAWQAAFELLLLSVIRMARLAIPSIKAAGGGAILFSTSSSVKEPIGNLTLSTVLRAGVSALAKTLSQELATDRIRVNQIIPGRIDTDRVRELDGINAKKAGISVEETRKRATAAIPLGRYGDPADYGRAAAFLLSDAASYITGATLQVDGGAIRSVV